MRYAIGYLVVIWTVFLFHITAFGIHPLQVSSLPFIFLAPLQHADLAHIISNSIPGAILAFLVRDKFWRVTLTGVILGGLGVWLIGGVGTNHIGASGVIYTWMLYVLLRGFYNRSLWQILVAAVLFFFYGSLLWGVLPSVPGVSWQGHLCGAISGVVAASRFREKPKQKELTGGTNFG
ncbi:MAG: rhomboid family intramembrane serine protease [Corynebacterium sp.]|nr:rhomboid family intramembrane serine protease [Corynebacterium sp.]